MLTDQDLIDAIRAAIEKFLLLQLPEMIIRVIITGVKSVNVRRRAIASQVTYVVQTTGGRAEADKIEDALASFKGFATNELKDHPSLSSLTEILTPAASSEVGPSSDSDSSSSIMPMILAAVAGVLLVIIVVVVVIWRRDVGRRGKQQRLISSSSLGNGYHPKPRKGYQRMSESPQGEDGDMFSAARLPANASKNRYRDILPYDHSRVKLQTKERARPGADFINANFVVGYDPHTPYIVCQGPKDNTIADFWQMIWEQQSTTIAMMTRLSEGNKEKVAQYWPRRLNQPVTYGNFMVTMDLEDDRGDYVIRSFELVNKAQHEASPVPRIVRQCQFLSWPDHGVPSDTTQFLRFRRLVHTLNEATTGPLVVHCSAGVGRAGTFVCIDAELERYMNEGAINIYERVYDLRQWRPSLVQTSSQYVFVHQAVVDEITQGPVPLSPDLSPMVVNFLRHYVPNRAFDFDLGANGRTVVDIGYFNLETRTKDRVGTQLVALVLCNDVAFLAAVADENDEHRLLSRPVDREALSVEDVQQEWDDPKFKVRLDKAYVLEAPSEEEKQYWLELLASRQQYMPSDQLKGPRLIPLKPETRVDTVNFLGLNDPWDKATQAELEEEWASIPKASRRKEERKKKDDDDDDDGGDDDDDEWRGG